jgi:uncharacterized membrane protein YphA (DoxX/SURF4 family)
VVKFSRFFKSDALSLVLRFVIGAVVLTAAIPKIMDIEKNSVYLIYSYSVFPMYPLNIARFLGTIGPFCEILIGLGLIFGVLTRLSAAGWGILSLAYLAIKLDIIFIQGRIIPCGCFAGIFPNLLVTQSIWIDIVSLLLCAQIVFANPKRRILSPWSFLPEKWQQSRLRYLW